MEEEDLDPALNNPMAMFVLSIDTLWKERIDQHLPEGSNWSHKPPLYMEWGSRSKDRHTSKFMSRIGVPDALRCAIWFINVVRATNPDLPMTEVEQHGTLQHVRVVDHGFATALKSIFPDESDELTITLFKFGLTQDEMDLILQGKFFQNKEEMDSHDLSDSGRASYIRLLYVIRRVFDIDYCPLLPIFVAVLLSRMPDSYAFTIIRTMRSKVHFYLPTSKNVHISWLKTFSDLMRRVYPGAAKVLEPTGILDPLGTGLDPIFRFLFTTVLQKEHAYRIIDIYTIEGYKALFRLSSFFICFSLAYLSEGDLKDSDSFWRGFRNLAFSDNWKFNTLIDQAYGFQLRCCRKRPNSYYPRRTFIARLMEENESWAENMIASSAQVDDSISSSKSSQSLSPLGFVEGPIPLVLLKHASYRLLLTEFLPQTFRGNKLELVYSSDSHGKNWQAFYGACTKMKHSIMVCEVLQKGSVSIIGMFATERWHNSASKVYGDGGCFFFRLTPDPVCYHWRNEDAKVSRTTGHDDKAVTTTEANTKALIKSYMYSGDDFIAMGANQSGSSGIRIYQYLSKGSSAPASGYNNAPLVASLEFDIGLVELYRLIL